MTIAFFSVLSLLFFQKSHPEAPKNVNKDKGSHLTPNVKRSAAHHDAKQGNETFDEKDSETKKLIKNKVTLNSLQEIKNKITFNFMKQNVSTSGSSDASFLAWNKLLILLIICILSVVLAAGFSLGKKSKIETETLIDLNKIINDLQKKFEDQHLITYRILRNALKKVINAMHKPAAPAIFTVIANKGAAKRASEFSQYLARSLAPERFVLIDEPSYWLGDPDNLKLKIDDKINSTVDQDHLGVVVVDNLQNIPHQAAMLFHGYCDHELAPYKRAVFLFIAPLNKSLEKDVSSRNMDIVATKELRKIWEEATSDDIDSLIVRMTVNVINIL